MNNLTEHNIKLASLRFLKEYYKFRPRSGETKISADMRGEGGIVADGYLTFPKEDKVNFIATLEATSFSTKDEVRFRLKREKLTWDCAALAFSSMAILMFVSHNLGFYAALRLGIFISLLLFGFSVAFFFGLFWLVLARMRRYRYIHATEQFKEYYADEQWVAIGEDVFPSYSDRYFLELQRQCVYYGFGLLVVNEALKPRMLITPARQQIFVGSRRLISFISLNELGRRVAQSRYASWAKRFTSPRLDEAKRWLTPYQSTFKHHRRRYAHQMTLISVSMISMLALFIGELNRKPVRELAQAAYQAEMEAKAKTNKRESFGFDVDTTSVQPFNKAVKPYIVMGPDATNDIIISAQSEGSLTYYDCSRFSMRSVTYIVQDTLVKTAGMAVRRIYELKAAGIHANALWLGCFNSNDTRYVVFAGLLHTSRREAENSSRAFEVIMAEAKMENQLQIRTLNPKK